LTPAFGSENTFIPASCFNALTFNSSTHLMNRDEMLEAFAGKAAAQIIKILDTAKNGK